MCGLGGMKKSNSTQSNSSIGEVQEVTAMQRFKSIFNKKELPFTIDQLWYRGIPNMARYCVWPLLIGNSLHIDRALFDCLTV